MTRKEAVKHCQTREIEERRASVNAANDEDMDVHFLSAERYADMAWSIGEGYRTFDDI